MTRSLFVHTDITGLIARGVGVLTSLTVSANGGASNCQIYDGLDANGIELFNIGQLDGSGLTPNLGNGIPINVGIYVVCADANIQVTIGFDNSGI